MTDLIDPTSWHDDNNINNPYTPTFTFSVYFEETKHNVEPKLAGAWLKAIDIDTINMLYETLIKINDKVEGNLQLQKEMSELLYLTQLIWQWETDKIWDCDPTNLDKAHLHAEYFWRLASLIHYEYLQRNGMKSKNKMFEEDNAKYNGKLAIFE